MDEEDVPKFSKLSVIPKVQELQKFGARKQGKIFLYISKCVNMHEQYVIKEVIHQEILNKRNGNCK